MIQTVWAHVRKEDFEVMMNIKLYKDNFKKNQKKNAFFSFIWHYSVQDALS